MDSFHRFRPDLADLSWGLRYLKCLRCNGSSPLYIVTYSPGSLRLVHVALVADVPRGRKEMRSLEVSSQTATSLLLHSIGQSKS